MRSVKKFFKPVVVLYAMIGIAVLFVCRKLILNLKLKPMYACITKLEAARKKMYRLIFNPYRIANGIRPAWINIIEDPAADISKCHEVISKARLARSAS